MNAARVAWHFHIVGNRDEFRAGLSDARRWRDPIGHRFGCRAYAIGHRIGMRLTA